MIEMEDLLKEKLQTSKLKRLGSSGGGCISDAEAFDTDQGKIFVKINRKREAGRMFEGEFKSLEAINKTGTVKTPKPYKVIDLPEGGCMLVMEYLDLKTGLSKYSSQLGRELASLHLHNSQLKEQRKARESFVGKQHTVNYIDRFGFEISTCCGYLPQDNSWSSDWLNFYSRKIEEQVVMAETEYKDREVRELWNTLLPRLPKLFTGLDDIQPALLHGDLWGGNASETSDGPVIYDPASFYGHAEYDLAISHMFGGFSREFFHAYHGVIPKADGFHNRLELYKLFHYLNHWNHFGGGYRRSSVSILNSLIKVTK